MRVLNSPLSLRENIKWWHSIALAAVLLLFPLAAKTADAAELYFSPSSKTLTVGENISVSVLVSSKEQVMNAASGVVSFPSDKLQVTSLSKAGSIFSLWVQEPAFSNSGTVNFEGIVLNPGFTGSGGKIITINFKAKAAGEAGISFSSGEVLANDGKGTNILNQLGGARIIINVSAAPSAQPQPQTPPAQTAVSAANGLPPLPQISSPTHPEQDNWYNNNYPKFVWPMPQGVTAVRLSFDHEVKGSTLVTYSPPIAEKALKGVEDGIWYFHAQFKNSKGWGPVATYRFQIDTKPPEGFKIEIVDGKEITYPRPTILFNTTDSLSGIDYYQVKVGESEFAVVSKEQVRSNPYTLPPQPPGKRTILVKAVDKAGNYTTDLEEVTIKSLEKPEVTSYQKVLHTGQNLVVKGTALPKIKLSFWLLKSDGDQPTRYQLYAEEDGTFNFISPEKLQSGVYYFWLMAINEDQATSQPTEKFTVVVGPTAFSRMVSRLTGWLALVVPLVGLLILLFLFIWYGWHKFRVFKKKIGKEAGEAESALHRGFKALKENLAGYMKVLESARSRRKLTVEENKINRQLKKDLDEMEHFIGKEIEDIEKEVR